MASTSRQRSSFFMRPTIISLKNTHKRIQIIIMREGGGTKRKAKKQRLSKTSTKIAIIGTGPAALSAALSLQQAGFTSITLYERDSNFNARKDGYGLTLTYNPSTSIHSPLTKLGLLEEVARKDCPSRSHYVFHSSGKILGYYGNAFEKNRWKRKGMGQRGNLRVPRQVLRKTMMDALLERRDQASNVKIEWGRKLSSYDTNNVPTCMESDTGEGEFSPSPLTLKFEDGTTAFADFLIGADGVRSKVIHKLLKMDVSGSGKRSTNNETMINSSPLESNAPIENLQRNPADLSYLGIMIILGITTDFFHPLLDERGFYTLDGNHRLFTMPFEGSRLDDLENYNIELQNDSEEVPRSRRYMWQLSFNLGLEEANALSKGGPQKIVDEVLRRTKDWHKPVQDMVLSTPLETVWGTPLMDRDPRIALDKMKEIYRGDNELRTVIMGDAVHPMSPFKGQGCNQSLMDGPLLCSWLEKSNLNSCVNGFMREMVQRTHKKVLASREAAQFLHSDDVLLHKESFAGVEPEMMEKLLKTLNDRNITANLGGLIDSKVAEVIDEIGGFKNDTTQNSEMPRDEVAESAALKYACEGNLAEFRKLSMKSPEAIRAARHPETGETCLHVAAKFGHYHTVKWLISEACLDFEVLDKKNQSVVHSALISGNLKVSFLIARICRKSQGCWGKNDDGIKPQDLVKDECDRKSLEDAIVLHYGVLGSPNFLI